MGKKSNTVSKKAKRLTKKNKGYRAPGGGKKSLAAAEAQAVPSNPFEFKVNKRKHESLGRVQKHETGRPLIAKSKAVERRKRTLLPEYISRNKTNLLVDKRLGEKSKSFEEEEKLVRRTALEKTRQYKNKKNSLFNLNDEEESLTHKGMSLNDIQRYDDPRDQSDSEDERLNEDFVNVANFGGFMKMKSKSDGDKDVLDEFNADGTPKSREQIIAEMILQSKKRKFEKAKEMDENFELINELDTTFKDPEFKKLLLSVPTKKEEMLEMLGRKKEKTVPISAEPKPVQEPYDRLVRELQFATKFDGEKARVNTEVVDIQDGQLLQITDDYKKFEESVLQSCVIRYVEVNDEPDTNQEFPEFNVEELNSILTRVVKYYKVTEKSKLIIICKHLLEFVTIWADYPDGLNFVFEEHANWAVSLFHTMVLSDPKACSEVFLDRIGVMKSRFDDTDGQQGTICESMNVIFALCTSIFPTRELRHRVLSPAVIFMLQIFNEVTTYNSPAIIDRGLTLCCEAYKFVKDTKRYCSEPLTWLCNLLSYYHPRSRKVCLSTSNVKSFYQSLKGFDGPEFIDRSLTIIQEFIGLYKELPTASCIFKPIRTILKHLRSNEEWGEMNWTEECSAATLKVAIQSLLDTLDNFKVEMEPIRLAPEIPKRLKLYEPEVEENFDGRKKKNVSRVRQERTRLAHKVKKETKSAVRELKQDNAFLARTQQKHEMQLDKERKRKVNAIMGSLSNQEGDYKKLTKKKK